MGSTEGPEVPFGGDEESLCNSQQHGPSLGPAGFRPWDGHQGAHVPPTGDPDSKELSN